MTSMPLTSPGSGSERTAGRVPGQAAPPGAISARPKRRRTLGRCAHCGTPVEMGEEYVRLHRRAWHLECALGAQGTGDPVSWPAAGA